MNKDVFQEETTRQEVLRIFQDIASQTGAILHVFVVACDHVHGLLTLPPEKKLDLPEYIGKAKVKTTQVISEKGGQARPYAIWQRSYYDHVIRNEQDFTEKANYIEGHPFKEEGSVHEEWH